MSASNALVVVGIGANQTRDIVSAAGKVVGTRLCFGGGESASELKARLKSQGMKGRELTEKVNDILCGRADVRWVEHDAAVSAMRSAGLVPDLAEVRKKTGCVRYVRPVDPEKSKSEKLAAENAELARQLAETQEQIKALKALWESRSNG